MNMDILLDETLIKNRLKELVIMSIWIELLQFG